MNIRDVIAMGLLREVHLSSQALWAHFGVLIIFRVL